MENTESNISSLICGEYRVITDCDEYTPYLSLVTGNRVKWINKNLKKGV